MNSSSSLWCHPAPCPAADPTDGWRAGLPPKAPTATVRSSLSSPHPGLAASTACRVVLPHLSSCGRTVMRTFQHEDLLVKTQMSPVSGGSMNRRWLGRKLREG